MKTKFVYLIFILIFGSCTKVETINLKNHSFNTQAKRIVWLQVPGLDREHLAMLKFTRQGKGGLTSFEQSTCIGSIWTYNLYLLRPEANASFLSQMTGSKNINSKCSDYKDLTVWNVIKDLGGWSSVLEVGVPEESSLSKAWDCGSEATKFKNDLTLFKMAQRGGNVELFHFQENREFSKGKVYYDKSCQQGPCYSSVLNNVKFVRNHLDQNKNLSLFIVRDYRFLKAMNKRDIVSAREILTEIEAVHDFFRGLAQKNSDTLLLVSSASPRRMEFPPEGRKWYEFESKGKHVFYRRPALISPTWALGPGAENFCGSYGDADILKRIFWSPKTGNIGIKGLFSAPKGP